MTLFPRLAARAFRRFRVRFCRLAIFFTVMSRRSFSAPTFTLCTAVAFGLWCGRACLSLRFSVLFPTGLDRCSRAGVAYSAAHAFGSPAAAFLGLRTTSAPGPRAAAFFGLCAASAPGPRAAGCFGPCTGSAPGPRAAGCSGPCTGSAPGPRAGAFVGLCAASAPGPRAAASFGLRAASAPGLRAAVFFGLCAASAPGLRAAMFFGLCAAGAFRARSSVLVFSFPGVFVWCSDIHIMVSFFKLVMVIGILVLETTKFIEKFPWKGIIAMPQRISVQ
jgi:hypothetical protein